MPIIYMSLFFGLSEFILMLLKRSGKKKSRMREDQGSLTLLWIVITAGFIAGFFLSGSVNNLILAIGIFFIITGLFLRWIAILQLGKSFTVDVAITDAASLKTNGIYSRVRHPSYSGLLCVITGFALAMGSIFPFVIFVIPVFSAVIYRIAVEEKVLINEFGDSYMEYIKRTKRIIPGIY